MRKDYGEANKGNKFNKVYLRGKVVAYGTAPNGAPTFVVMVKRGVKDENGKETAPIMIDVAYGNAKIIGAEEVKLQRHVEVEGHLVAYSYRNEIWGKWSYVQFVMADNIEAIKPKLTEVFGVEGFAFDPYYSEYYMKGEVEYIRKPENGRGWIVMTVNAGKDASVRTQFSSKMRVNDVGRTCQVGDIVCLTGTIHSTIKEGRENRNVKFENLLIDDLAVIKRAEDKNSPAKENGVADGEEKEDKPQDNAAEANIPDNDTGSGVKSILDDVLNNM